jgi:hypothetical protein
MQRWLLLGELPRLRKGQSGLEANAHVVTILGDHARLVSATVNE